jgi:hypothetical protein
VSHPLFKQVFNFSGDQAIPKAELRPPHANHGSASGLLKRLCRRVAAGD